MRISFNPLAERELNEAAQYYAIENPDLGAAFLTEVERACQFLTEHAESGPLLQGSVRRRLLARFPYALLYSIRGDTIRILAVMNLRRRPGYWVGRQ
jgi:plasmid stabilization system protein ParE